MDQDPNISYEQPLSPVLCSSIRKIIKRKKKSSTNLIDRIQNESQTLLENSRITECRLNTDENNDSLKQQVNFQVTEPLKTTTHDGKTGFQTASGKQLSSKMASSDIARILFSEILNPTVETQKEKKFNFLSKTKHSKLETEKSDLNLDDLEFKGFDRNAFIDSKEKLSMQINIVCALKRKFTNDKSLKKISEINKRKKLIESNSSIIDTNIRLHNNNLIEQNGACEKSIKPKTPQEGLETEIIQTYENSEGIVNIQTSQNTIHTTKKSDIKDSGKSIGNFNINTLKDDINETKILNGFSTASGKNIKVSTTTYTRINQIFKDISESETDHFLNIPPSKDSKDSGCQLFEKLDRVPIVECEDIPELNVRLPSGTLNAPKEQNKNAFKSARNSDEMMNSNLEINKVNSNPNLKIDEKLLPTDSSKNTAESFNTFSTASGKKIAIPAVSFAKVNNIFKDIPDLNTKTISTPHSDPDNLKIVKCTDGMNVMKGFSTASGAKIEIPAASLSKLSKIFGDIPDMNVEEIALNVDEEKPVTKSTLPIFNENADSNISMNTAQDNVTPVRPIPRKKKLGSAFCRDGKMSELTMSRVKCLFSDMNFDDLKLPGRSKVLSSPCDSPKISFSTPMRPNGMVSSPHFSKNFTPTPQARRSFTDKNGSFMNEIPHEYNCPYLIQKPTSGDLKSWAEELSRQRMILEKKLSLVSRKYEAISTQIDAEFQIEKTKPQYVEKKRNEIILKDLPNMEIQFGKVENVNNVILQINPQNAALIHFNGNWSDVATVTTADGCILIPNQQNLIGLSEIGASLESLPNIKKNLIPDGWIKNHYKWIIWKLASYERFFPSTLGGCFTIDNVMKQLQYRYNREIFNAERPALRKIYEKDDVSQKRMILCISNIFKNKDTIELELTDGWYSIRTLIDDLLCSQVNKKKIRIGSKLIISGAELLNCEGCHPLETEQASKVRLKISFNSTRRAAWFSKLGYQKNPMPLSIKLSTVQAGGGVIGAAKVYIMRAYPVIYMEKLANSNVWRNQHAEMKKIQAFENEYYNEYESRGENEIGTNKIKKRNVIPVFQMTVLDATGDRSKPFKCTVWNSTDFHVEQLKENQIVSFYNLSLRSKNELSCNMKTRFENKNEDVSEFADYKRKYVSLGDIHSMLANSDFSEFDTVGYVVEVHVQKENQHFWLSDLQKNLLLVEINESPEKCLLLNRIEEQQLIAVCNIKFVINNKEYSLAEASFHSVVTNYPQYTFLRDALSRLEQINKTDLNALMESCKMKISSLNGEKNSNGSEGNVLHLSQVTCTDIAMSMINIDEVINNTK